MVLVVIGLVMDSSMNLILPPFTSCAFHPAVAEGKRARHCYRTIRALARRHPRRLRAGSSGAADPRTRRGKGNSGLPPLCRVAAAPATPPERPTPLPPPPLGSLR